VHQEGQKDGWKGDEQIIRPLSQISKFQTLLYLRQNAHVCLRSSMI